MHGGGANVGIADSSGTFTFTGCSITSPTAIAFNVSGSTATNTANVAYTGLITQANNYAAVSVANHTGGTMTFSRPPPEPPPAT